MVVLKLKEDYIQTYEKEYRKTNLIFYGIAIIGIFMCILSVCLLVAYDKSLVYYCIPAILTGTVMSNYRKRSYINNRHFQEKIMELSISYASKL